MNFVISLLKNIIEGFILYGKRIYVHTRLGIRNPSCLFDRTSIINKCQFEKYVVVFKSCELYNAKIGSYSYVQMNARVFNCEIGRFCSIAANVTIAPGMHDMNRVTTHPAFYFFTHSLPKIYVERDMFPVAKNVKIGHDVWIGERVVILDGVNIGNGAVIAAGAVVIKDVEPYSVVGGIPAKHIKYRFDPETIMILQKSEWWNFSDGWFEENSELMLDINKFIESHANKNS
jgi:acetyltransferase-like isoleucine patch superfamily enzyme